MNLVLHIVKPDLRHTWPYAAVWLAALTASWWINLQVLADRIEYVGLQGADAIAHAALALFTAMLFLAGPRPGARPMRSRDLLLAKALTLGLTAVLPFALTHWATVALRGFPLHEHALELTWNAVLVVAAGALPVAALASVSRNLQTVVLMLLGCFVVTLVPHLHYSSNRPWGEEATALWIVLAGAAGVVCWQARFRRETAGRVAIAALYLLAASTVYWPADWWRVLRRATCDSGDWNELDSKLPPGWERRIVRFKAGWPWSTVFAEEQDLSAPGKQYELPRTQGAHLPGVGWCRPSAAPSFSVDCQYVGRPSGTLLVRLGPFKAFESERPVAPRWAIPFQHPVQQFKRNYRHGRPPGGPALTIEAREPIGATQFR